MAGLRNVCDNHAYAFYPPAFRYYSDWSWLRLLFLRWLSRGSWLLESDFKGKNRKADFTYSIYLHILTFRHGIIRICKDYSVWGWRWHMLRFCLMIWQHLVSLILLPLFLSSTFQIDRLYCPDWRSVRSMSAKLVHRLFSLSDGAWIFSFFHCTHCLWLTAVWCKFM